MNFAPRVRAATTLADVDAAVDELHAQLDQADSTLVLIFASPTTARGAGGGAEPALCLTPWWWAAPRPAKLAPAAINIIRFRR